MRQPPDQRPHVADRAAIRWARFGQQHGMTPAKHGCSRLPVPCATRHWIAQAAPRHNSEERAALTPTLAVTQRGTCPETFVGRGRCPRGREEEASPPPIKNGKKEWKGSRQSPVGRRRHCQSPEEEEEPQTPKEEEAEEAQKKQPRRSPEEAQPSPSRRSHGWHPFVLLGWFLYLCTLWF